MMTSTILTVDNLSVAFRQGDGENHVVKNISFSIEKGKTLALVGESGSGKSVTAHAILKLLPYPMAFHPSGSITFEEKDLLTLSNGDMRAIRGNRIGMIFQEPMMALNPLHSIEKQISEVVINHKGLDKQAAREETLRLLKRVKIKEAEKRLGSYPHELSGGQRQRVMIAMALANEPELLIADEPTTALDVTVQKEIMQLLKELQNELQMAILLITHDLGVVRHYSDHIAVMHKGELIEQAQTEKLFQSPEQEYTQVLLNSEPSGTPDSYDENNESILKAENLCVSFPLHNPLFGKPTKFLDAVKNIQLEVKAGSTLGIVGESGSGKSTLAMALLRLIESQGSILFHNKELQGLTQKAIRPLRRHLQIVFQDPFASLSPRMTVMQIIAEGLALHSTLSDEEISNKVIATMGEVGLDPETCNRYPHEFSGGQRQRIAIARALILDPKVIFLDEPTSALDRAIQMQIVDLLRQLQKQHQLTYIFISHDLKVVKALSHNVAVMKAGEIVEYGSAKQVFEQAQHDYTKQLLDAALS